MDQLTPEDVDFLRMIAGCSFNPLSILVLPSGRQLSPDEGQALTSAYAPALGEPPADEAFKSFRFGSA